MNYKIGSNFIKLLQLCKVFQNTFNSFKRGKQRYVNITWQVPDSNILISLSGLSRMLVIAVFNLKQEIEKHTELMAAAINHSNIKITSVVISGKVNRASDLEQAGGLIWWHVVLLQEERNILSSQVSLDGRVRPAGKGTSFILANWWDGHLQAAYHEEIHNRSYSCSRDIRYWGLEKNR